MSIMVTWIQHASFRIADDHTVLYVDPWKIETQPHDADEAARACEAIGCKAAIPYHWGDIVGSERDAERFASAAACDVKVLQPGESMQI